MFYKGSTAYSSMKQIGTYWESSDSVTGCICCSSNASTAGRNTQISRNSKEVEEPQLGVSWSSLRTEDSGVTSKRWQTFTAIKVGQSYHKEFGVSVPDIGDIILEVHLLHSQVTSSYKNNTEHPKVEPLQRVTSCQKVEWWCMSFT